MDLKLKKILWKMEKVVDKIDDLDPFCRVLEDKVNNLERLGYSFEEICECMYKDFEIFLSDNDYRLYLAYGSNMDINQMDYRCPNSYMFDNIIVDNYKFVLDVAGVASIIPSEGDKVEAILWAVHELDVETLDRYEGVSLGCYEKTTMPIVIDGAELDVLVYFSLRDLNNHGYRSGYMSRIIQAAIDADFSEEYIEELASWNN